MTFTKDTIIGEVLDHCPEAAPLFLEIRMHCLGCPSARSETNDPEVLLNKLNELAAK